MSFNIIIGNSLLLLQLDTMMCSLLAAVALMTIVDKLVMAVTCWECNPCQKSSHWRTCVGTMCYNYTDKHGRGMQGTIQKYGLGAGKRGVYEMSVRCPSQLEVYGCTPNFFKLTVVEMQFQHPSVQMLLINK